MQTAPLISPNPVHLILSRPCLHGWKLSSSCSSVSATSSKYTQNQTTSPLLHCHLVQPPYSPAWVSTIIPQTVSSILPLPPYCLFSSREPTGPFRREIRTCHSQVKAMWWLFIPLRVKIKIWPLPTPPPVLLLTPSAPATLASNTPDLPLPRAFAPAPLSPEWTFPITCMAHSAPSSSLSRCHFFFFFFLGPHPWHVEVPRLGVKSEVQLPSYATATATQDLSRICNLHHSSQQHQILNPLIEAGYWTHILMDASQVCYCWAMTGAPRCHLLNETYPDHTKNMRTTFTLALQTLLSFFDFFSFSEALIGIYYTVYLII